MAAYGSCQWLQGHIEFSHDGALYACHGYAKRNGGPGYDWEEIPPVQMSVITNDRFPDREISKRRLHLHSVIARDEADADADICIACPQMKAQEWPETSFLVSEVAINTWTHCNLKCTYCGTKRSDFKPDKAPYDLAAVVGDMLGGRHLDPAGCVTWVGGDISVLPEFDLVSELFLAYGVFQVFKTSGYNLRRGVVRAVEKRLGIVEASLDAGARETYRRVKGRDAFERVVANLREYSIFGPIELKYVAMIDNFGDADIEGFLELTRKLNVSKVIITPDWTDSEANSYGDDFKRSLTKLIGSLRGVVPVTIPSNRFCGAAICF